MNWGNKILLTFIVFGAGMFYLVYRSLSTQYELVEKDYYNSELRYQQVIDGTNRVNQLSSPVKVEQTANGITLELPSEMKNKTISGDIWFYCSYDAKRDKRFPLTITSEGSQLFPSSAILPGSYIVKINWDNEGNNYFSEKNLTVQ